MGIKLSSALEGVCCFMALIILTFLTVSCGSKPSVVAPTPASNVTTSQEKPEVKSGWEARWEKTLAMAGKEGRVILVGPDIADIRRAFIEEFQKAYPGITLDYTGLSGAAFSPKIKAERRAGLYLVDLYIGGTTTILTRVKEFAVPIKPLLILPEVTDPKLWFGGSLDFADKAEEVNLVFGFGANSRVVYNSEQVNPSELTSFWDVTKPRWKGKIIMHDPMVAGSGLAAATFWYVNKQLGADFLKALAANEPVLSRSRRVQAENVARGKYSIGLAVGESAVLEFQGVGMPIKFAKVMKEGTYNTPGVGSVMVVDRAPHPNAAAVFLNWVLGKEGQTAFTTNYGYASRRLDVTTEHLSADMTPDPNADYFPNYKEEFVTIKDELLPQLQKIFLGS